MPLDTVAQIVVFGLTLGQPLPLPECGPTEPQLVTCQRNYAPSGPNPWSNTFIIWTTATVPEIAASATFGAWKIDGRLAGLDFDTAGVDDQDLVVRRLTDKFGKPTSLVQLPMQTNGGAKVISLIVKWDRPDVFVVFESALGRIDHGAVKIMTREAKAIVDARDAADTARRAKL